MHIPIPIRGPLAVFLKPFGIKKSQMHPNLCTICELMFTKVKKQKQIQISTTILFADLRGYTKLSEEMDAANITDMLHYFYDHCATAIWEREGIVNKFIGDAVLAIFNFPLEREDHVKQAVMAAVDLQTSCLNIKKEIGLGDMHEVGVGIGIHSGIATIGEVGTSYKDFTAVGPVVNLASRLQNQAKPGEIIMTEEVYDEVKEVYLNAKPRTFNLKGINRSVTGFVISLH